MAGLGGRNGMGRRGDFRGWGARVAHSDPEAHEARDTGLRDPGRAASLGTGSQRRDARVADARGRKDANGLRKPVGLPEAIVRSLAQVAVGHARGRVRVGDQAQLGPAGQERVPGDDADRVTERPGNAQLHRSREPR